jgi:hypothetical protein
MTASAWLLVCSTASRAVFNPGRISAAVLAAVVLSAAPSFGQPAPDAPPPDAPPPGSPEPAAPQPAAPQTDAPPAPAAPPPPASTTKLWPDEAKSVLGQQVFTTDGQNAGRLVDVLVDQDGAPRAGIIDFGGFMGLGNRRVSVAWSALRFDPSNKQHPITMALTPDQVRAAPEYKGAPDKPAQVVTPPDPQTPADPQAKPDEQVAPDGK